MACQLGLNFLLEKADVFETKWIIFTNKYKRLYIWFGLWNKSSRIIRVVTVSYALLRFNLLSIVFKNDSNFYAHLNIKPNNDFVVVT